MADRLLEVGDVAVAAINAAWTTQTASDSASREYGLEENIETIAGRKVILFPLGDEEVERLDKATIVREYRFAIVIVEKYSEPGLPTKEWTDERVNFVSDKVYDTLNVDKESDYLGTPATLYTQSIRRDVAYDFDAWRDYSVFWSEVNLALREKIAG